MYKTVKAAIASAKLSVRHGRLPDEDWRLLLHNALEKYHTFAIKENKDFYTHELEATLSYVSPVGYEVSVETFRGAQASGSFFLGSPITENESLIINGLTFYFVTAEGDPPVPRFVLYSGDLEGTATNLAGAINNAFETVTATASGTTVTVTYDTVGTAGNDFTLLDSSLAAVEATPMSGGLDATETRDYYPIALLYQDESLDPETDYWGRIRIVKYSQYLTESTRGRPLASFIGNEWQGIQNATMKLNLTQDWVDAQRFRLAFRYFPSTELDYDDSIPFPQEHTQLLEINMAREALDLIEDNSPDWDKFYARRAATLEARLKEFELGFTDWLLNDVENVVVVDTPYHYAFNNKLRVRRPRYRINWTP